MIKEVSSWKRIKLGNRRGQVWVETVIYTLIAFTLIGLVLTFVKPEIDETRDKGLVEQSIQVMNDIDLIIRNIGTPGNQRVVKVGISKGELNIDGVRDLIFFDLESQYKYSESGQKVGHGSLVIYTTEEGAAYNVNITSNYSGGYNLKFQNVDELRRLGAASTPYRISISNDGLDTNGDTIINFDVVI